MGVGRPGVAGSSARGLFGVGVSNCGRLCLGVNDNAGVLVAGVGAWVCLLLCLPGSLKAKKKKLVSHIVQGLSCYKTRLTVGIFSSNQLPGSRNRCRTVDFKPAPSISIFRADRKGLAEGLCHRYPGCNPTPALVSLFTHS